MLEKEWLKSADAVEMLDALPSAQSERKLRLFACACCRHFESSIPAGSAFTSAVQAAETFADRQSSKAALKRARQSVRAERHALADTAKNRMTWVGLWLAEVTASENAYAEVADEIKRFVSERLLKPHEQPPAASLLRCIIGNPFQSTSVNPAWASPSTELASTIYDRAVFDQLPRLARQLKSAGCTDNVLLKHCRSKTSHAKGCWVVDLLLGKS